MLNYFCKRLFTGIFFGVSIFLIVSCSSKKEVKGRIIYEMRNAGDKEISIDLNRYSGGRIRKICIQPPYLTKNLMEKMVGEKVDDFSEVDDKFFVLWIFRDAKIPMKIKFHRWEEINFGEPPAGCASTSWVKIVNSQLYLSERE